MKDPMKPTSASPGARAFAASLREVRVAHGITVRALADKLRIPPPMLSQWETGYRLPPTETLARLLGLLDVDEVTYERLMYLHKHAREDNWLDSNPSDIPPALSGIVEYERTATAIFNWALALVPGLLQTPDYARAILSASQISLEQADMRLVTRLNRQNILTKPDPVQLTAIIDEMVIHREVGDSDIMSDQMDHLIAISGRENISLRIVPANVGHHAGLAGPFMIYEFEKLAPIVHLEHHYASAFLYEDHSVGVYHEIAKMLAGKALSEEVTREMLREAAR